MLEYEVKEYCVLEPPVPESPAIGHTHDYQPFRRYDVELLPAIAITAVAIAGTLAAVSPLLDARHLPAAACGPAQVRQSATPPQ